MPWETKTLKTLETIYNNDDSVKQTWAVSRRVDEAAGKKYARELQRTVYYTKDGEAKSFPVNLTLQDFNWIVANRDIIKSELAPGKPVEAAAKPAEVIEETPF